MHAFTKTTLAATSLLTLLTPSSALGINCRGSGLCDRAGWNNPSSESVIQILHDAVWASSKSNSTTYNSGDHIICVSQSQAITIDAGASYEGVSGSFSLNGNIHEGGVCLFPQGASLTLGQIRPLTSAILEHKCTNCGSVPIHFVDEKSNDPGSGILTFNYVSDPFCDGNCMSGDVNPTSAAPAAASTTAATPPPSTTAQASTSAAPTTTTPASSSAPASSSSPASASAASPSDPSVEVITTLLTLTITHGDAKPTPSDSHHSKNGTYAKSKL